MVKEPWLEKVEEIQLFTHSAVEGTINFVQSRPQCLFVRTPDLQGSYVEINGLQRQRRVLIYNRFCVNRIRGI